MKNVGLFDRPSKTATRKEMEKYISETTEDISLVQGKVAGQEELWAKKGDDQWLTGSRTQEKCMKEGFIWMKHKATGEKQLVRTHCKLWECRACRDSVKSLFSLRIMYGLLTLSPSMLITLTFKVGSKEAVDASSAKKAWTRWLRLFRMKYPGTEYMAVPELTKKKVPHLHLVIGNSNGLFGNPADATRTAKCNAFASYDEHWKDIKCQCLTHVSSKIMMEVTKGRSWVVDVTPTKTSNKLAWYLGKYLTKDEDRYHYKRLGFHRRWSRSKGWPSPQPIHLKMLDSEVSPGGDWVKEGWSPASSAKSWISRGLIKEVEKPELEGDDLRLTILKERAKVRTIIQMQRMLSNESKNNW